jgi:hypothetical protein
MHLLQGKDVAEEVDVFYTPAYAAGSVMVDSLLSNVLLSQTYYKSDIVTILKALCGMPGPLYDKHSKLKKEFKHLHLVPVPLPFVGKSYLALFESFLLDHEATCLGLYRAPEEQMGNELPFVYTNPVSSLLLKKTDRIYLLASPGWFY